MFPKITPIRPKLKRLPFDDPDFFFELKYDGYRGIFYNWPGVCKLVSKIKEARQFPRLEKKLKDRFRDLPVILDGEVCFLDEKGYPDFKRLHARHEPVVYIVFDIMWLGEMDLREMPLHERKTILKRVISTLKDPCIQLASSIQGHGKELFNEAVRHGLEGIVAKYVYGTYNPKTRWYKIKNPDYSKRFWRK